MPAKRSWEDTIHEFKLVHAEDYSYPFAIYYNGREKIEMFCNTCCRYFWQNAQTHLRGIGCPKCGRRKVGDKNRKDFTYFVERAEDAHGNFYKYYEETFDGMMRHTKITCPAHGDFWQHAGSHCAGHGCSECALDRHRKSEEEFFAMAKDRHGDTKDYSETVFNGWGNKLTVRCKKHGYYTVTASSHVKNECPKCANENKIGGYNKTTMDRNPDKYRAIPAILYYIWIVPEGDHYKNINDCVKVGITKKSAFRDRMMSLRRESGCRMVVISTYEDNLYDLLYLEQDIHNVMKDHQYLSKQKFDGRTEVYGLDASGQLNKIFYALKHGYVPKLNDLEINRLMLEDSYVLKKRGE